FFYLLGMNRVVILNSYEGIKEALMTRGTDFAGRPTDSIPAKIASRNFTSLGHGDYSKSWAFLRKLSYKGLHVYGTGMKKIEDIITEEVDKMCSILSQENGQPTLITSFIGNSLVNTICHLCFNKTYHADDPEFKHIMSFSKLIDVGLSPGQAIVIFPWLRFFPDTEKFKNLKLGTKQRDDFTNKMFNEHIESFNPENIRDLTDNLLHLSLDKEMWKDAGFEEVTQSQLESVVNSIFFAGTLTQLATFQWFVVFIVQNPAYQTKMYQEIVNKFGQKHQITAEDKENLPYSEAVLKETNRLGSIAPLAIPHKTTVDTSIGGHPISKGTKILLNLYSMHHDPAHWDEPEKFKPERWLNADGSLKKEKPSHYFPFGAGTRVCLGDRMAKIQIFLIVTRLLVNFEVSLAPGEPMPDLKAGIMGLTYSPASKFKIVLTPRDGKKVN
uniref:Uncharacterized protein n=1 Tax=Clytia hemisphaerica TaxID=252671 RepID=A0A7M5VDG6_9CNID